MTAGAMALAVVCAACAQAEPARPPEPPGRDWQTGLGVRAATVEFRWPVVDRVVLVPDADTYLDEIAEWSPSGRWPVLFVDDHLAPMFIRRFAPAEVVLREPLTPRPAIDVPTRVDRAVAHAWGARDVRLTPGEAFAARGHVPPGIVVASAQDPAWTAALALAAGRGQPIVWTDDDYGRPNRTLDLAGAERLRAFLAHAAAQSGQAWAGLGDAIDAVTVCRRMAGGVQAPMPIAIVQRMGGVDPRAIKPPFATTDWITRHDDGGRWAMCGWIFGDEGRAAYMAMCALFLPRDAVFALHTYESGKPWDEYDPAPIANDLRAKGFHVDVRGREQATPGAWTELLKTGIDADVIYMTSKGNARDFELAIGPKRTPGDVPVLRRPAMLCMVHSYSLAAPERLDTVGGRWLAHGVYAYAGSMDEPFVAAFVPGRDMFARCAALFPFLAATRQFPAHPLSVPWKVQTIGDPLLTLVAPENVPERPRVRVTKSKGRELHEAVTQAWRTASETRSAEDYARAAELLGWLSDDERSSLFWGEARQQALEAVVAKPMLGMLYRAQRAEELRYAMSLVDDPDPIHLDMLWDLYGPLLPGRVHPEVIDLMLRCVRGPDVHVDLTRIAPYIVQLNGPGRLRDIVTRELDRTERRAVRRGLEQLLARYGG